MGVGGGEGVGSHAFLVLCHESTIHSQLCSENRIGASFIGTHLASSTAQANMLTPARRPKLRAEYGNCKFGFGEQLLAGARNCTLYS